MGKQLIVEEMRIPFPAFPGFDLNRMRLGGDSVALLRITSVKHCLFRCLPRMIRMRWHGLPNALSALVTIRTGGNHLLDAGARFQSLTSAVAGSGYQAGDVTTG